MYLPAKTGVQVEGMYRHVVIIFMACLSLVARAQYNIEKLLRNGQVALHYEDYVLSIQYFNQIIALKPYLYEPWQYRAVAKFYLDDFTGAEADISKAIELNPYIHQFFDLRAITKIRQERYDEAITDYNRAIRLQPRQQSYWFNRAVCLMNEKKYDEALLQTDTIVQKWANAANAYSLKAEIYLHQKDTTQAAKSLDKSLKIDPYDGNTWTTRAYISLARRKWKDADEELSKAIHLKPNVANNYVNRALARLNYNNLRGAMADYDLALDLAPNDFLAHYNRGLLRMQLGDDNRAIEDFDFVIKMEPKNVMAIFNRALLHDRTGDLRAAIRDYSAVIDQFPNFWTGLSYRANCYRRLGMTAKAEMDEFRIFKAQMDKRSGVQKRWSNNKLKAMRKRSEIDPEKYNQIVVADENTVEREYESEYRGQIQHRKVDVARMPMFEVSYLPYHNGMNTYQAFNKEIEDFNDLHHLKYPLNITCNSAQLTEEQSKAFLSLIDQLSASIQDAKDMKAVHAWLLQRAVAYSVTQNFDEAINDLNVYLDQDSTSTIAYWQRAVCQFMMNDFNASHGVDIQLKAAKTLDDFNQAIKLDGQNAYLYYNRGNFHAARKDYQLAIDDYTKAIELDSRLAEAYYNRGIIRLENTHTKNAGIADLSKAGELGIYDAYGVIKRKTATK